MAAGESYMDGVCRMLRSMVGKTTVSTQRRTVESEWTLTVTIGDAPPWLRSDNWMLPIHAADAIDRLRGELEIKTDELNRLREIRDRWIAATQLHAARAYQSPPEIRSHSDSADA
jgi:hypothetical protein